MKEISLRKRFPSVPSAEVLAAQQLLLTIGRAGVLSGRVIASEEFETLLRLLGPPSDRQRGDLKQATDIVPVSWCTVAVEEVRGRNRLNYAGQLGCHGIPSGSI